MPIFCMSYRADVDQQHFRRAGDAGLLVDEFPPAINDADVKFLLDLAEARRQGRAIKLSRLL